MKFISLRIRVNFGLKCIWFGWFCWFRVGCRVEFKQNFRNPQEKHNYRIYSKYFPYCVAHNYESKISHFCITLRISKFLKRMHSALLEMAEVLNFDFVRLGLQYNPMIKNLSKIWCSCKPFYRSSAFKPVSFSNGPKIIVILLLHIIFLFIMN